MTHLFPTDENALQGPWVAEQVDALANLVDVSVLCCSQVTSDAEVVRASGVRVTYRRMATPLGRGRAGLVASSVRYDRIARRYLAEHAAELDLVHAHFGLPDAIVAARTARRHGLPLVVTLHGDDAFKVLSDRGPAGSRLRDSLEYASKVICVSVAMEDALAHTLGRSSKTMVVQNGYDAGLFRVSERPRDIGILFVGLLVPVKNVDVLLRAYAGIRERLGAMPLVVAGDGPLRSSLEALAVQLGVEHSVRLLGEQTRSEVAELMSRARCLALPSSSEGWGVVAAEALACGTPVVASRVGGLPEILTGPTAGELVEAGDQEALAEALVRVATTNHNPRLVASANGARPWSEQARMIAEVYDHVLARHSPAERKP